MKVTRSAIENKPKQLKAYSINLKVSTAFIIKDMKGKRYCRVKVQVTLNSH